jgi:uncharacterized protein
VRYASVEDLRRLAANGVGLDARDPHGQTALMLSARRGHGPVVAWLFALGAALDCTAKYGLSALMLAVVGGHVAIVRQLAEAGADVGLRGTGAPGFAGKTALDLALARKDSEMVDILRAAEARRRG